MRHTKKYFLIVFIALLAMGGLYYVDQYTSLTARTYKLSDFLDNPSALSGTRITGTVEGGVTLENATIKDTTFIDFKAQGSTIKNVTFENCKFIKANFRMSKLENVTFKGGVMTCKGDPKEDENLTSFQYCKFFGVNTFDNVRFEYVYMYDVVGDGVSYLIFKNMKDIISAKRPFTVVNGGDFYLRIDNCMHEGSLFASIGKRGTIYATNSTFTRSGFGSSSAKVIYIDNCKLLEGSSSGAGEIVVVKNSALCGGVGGRTSKEVYLLNNQYPSSPMGLLVLHGPKDAKFFLDGNNARDVDMNLLGGTIFLRNLDIKNLLVCALEASVPALNLQNVTIHEGDFEDALVKGGQWENVTIYGPVKMPKGKLENIKVRAFQLPNGPPIAGATSETIVDIKESSAPFEWPEIHVPTLDELGLKDPLRAE